MQLMQPAEQLDFATLFRQFWEGRSDKISTSFTHDVLLLQVGLVQFVSVDCQDLQFISSYRCYSNSIQVFMDQPLTVGPLKVLNDSGCRSVFWQLWQVMSNWFIGNLGEAGRLALLLRIGAQRPEFIMGWFACYTCHTKHMAPEALLLPLAAQDLLESGFWCRFRFPIPPL